MLLCKEKILHSVAWKSVISQAHTFLLLLYIKISVFLEQNGCTFLQSPIKELRRKAFFFFSFGEFKQIQAYQGRPFVTQDLF